ncbi:GNAT family N-acetyltransferase [Luedemannella flava]|uniref:GNAT family N-acetyltransferase n=1 Tax=Luedemannella flava TaxID=349316 RepID=A0ABP4XT47_9ACTN
MDVVLTTERLILRRFTPADVDLLVELDGDPEVMRFLTNGRPTPYATVRDEILPKIIQGYTTRPRHGKWATLDRSGEFLGWHSLKFTGDDTQAELGYRLRRAAWGHGYATEGARALIDDAFTTRGLRRVYAETMAVNQASRRVMEKSGLRYVRTFHLDFDDPIPGTEHGEVEYAITRDEWLAAG